MESNAEIDFRRRVSPRDLPELMDGDCSYEDFRGCLRSLEQINSWLLGYRPTLAWLNRLPPALRDHALPDHGLRDPVHIVDVGSGGGDLLRQIAGWARRRGIAVELTGIDLNPYAARAAAESTPKELGIAWVTGNAAVDGCDCAGWLVHQRFGAVRVELPDVFVGGQAGGVAPVCTARWAGILPARLPGRGLGAVAVRGWGSAGGGDSGALAAGTVVCGALEVSVLDPAISHDVWRISAAS